MAWAKRIILFVLTNILVVATISIILNLLGIGSISNYRGAGGLDLQTLAVFCLVWGFGGAFISLALSRVMAKWMMGVKVINPQNASREEMELVQMVHKLAHHAGLRKMPEVGMYQSPEVNAFATGPTKNRSLVAVSTGLLQRMNKDQVEGVLAHEVAHVANGDMVTMTLLQGIINAFVMFIARILASVITSAMSRDEDNRGSGGMQFMLVMALEFALGFLGMIVVCAFSRWREYRADNGGANLAGRQKMISALKALQGTVERVDQNQPALAALKISNRPSLFSTHPPLEERIRRLEGIRY